MKNLARLIPFTLVLSLGLSNSAAGQVAPDARQDPGVESAQTQNAGPDWIIWETEAPVQRLALDGDSIWLGMEHAGLQRWDRARGALQSFGPAAGLPGEDTLALALDGDGDLWLAALDGGVAERSGGEFLDRTPIASQRLHPWALEAGPDEIWLATLGDGVARYSGGAWTSFGVEDGLPFEDVYALAWDPQGALWAGTLGYGAARFEAGVWSEIELPFEIEHPVQAGETRTNAAVTAIAVDADNVVWFASDGSGVAALAPDGAWTLYDSAQSTLPGDFVQAIHLDPQDNLWFGTLGGGAARLSADRLDWTIYNQDTTPLPDDDVLDLAVDEQGGVWLAAYDTGLAYYGPLPQPAPAFELDPRQAPEFEPGLIKGYFLWLDPQTYTWNLAWSGDGAEHAFKGELIADGEILLLGTSDLELTDGVQVDGNRLILDALEADGQDQISFQLARQVSELTLALKIDEAYYPFSLHIGSQGAQPGTTPFRLAVPQPVPPQVTLGEDLESSEGQLVQLRGEYTDPDSPTGHSLLWDLGDGTVVEDSEIADHVYLDDGEYTVSLTVTDVHGEVGADSLQVTVANVSPEVDFYIDPVLPSTGQLVTFEGYFYDPGEADSHTFTWSFGDGSDPVQTDEPRAEHVFSAPGEYEVSFTVLDDDGGKGTLSYPVTISEDNIAPIVNAGQDQNLKEGDQLLRAGSIEDSDSESWSGQADYGDGTEPKALIITEDQSFELNHTFADDGDYTVEISVTDNQGLTGVASFEVHVDNVAPVVDAGTDQTLLEGETFTGQGSFSDPGADDWTATVDYGLGDGPIPLTLNTDQTFSLEQAFASIGVYTVTVCVNDDDGGTGCDEIQVTVLHSFQVSCLFAFGDDNLTTPALVLRGDANLDCDIGSAQGAQIGNNTSLSGSVLNLDGETTIGTDSVIEGDITTGSDAKLRIESTLFGNLYAGGQVTLEQGVLVDGDVTAVNAISLVGDAQVTGTIEEGADPPPLPTISGIDLTLEAGAVPLNVPARETLSLEPGEYGQTRVRPGATLILSAGHYAFQGLQLEREAQLKFDLAGGLIVVDVVGDLVLFERARMDILGETKDATQILFRITGAHLTAMSDTTLIGTFVAPQAEIRLQENARLEGAAYGAILQLGLETEVIGRPAEALWIEWLLPQP